MKCSYCEAGEVDSPGGLCGKCSELHMRWHFLEQDLAHREQEELDREE